MKILNSHTHCQAALANPTIEAWQRVCLSQRSAETTNKQADEKEHQTGNSVYVAIAVKVVNRSFMLLSKFVASRQESASKTATSHIRKTL